jgi:hypothetical protein
MLADFISRRYSRTAAEAQYDENFSLPYVL